jgi:coenzyme F420-reducing hydrogenase alpha subunit
MLYFLREIFLRSCSAQILLTDESRMSMDKAKRTELDQIRRELINAHNRAAWHMAATIIKASLVKGGMDEPPTARELAELNATITNLRSVAEDAIELLKK